MGFPGAKQAGRGCSLGCAPAQKLQRLWAVLAEAAVRFLPYIDILKRLIVKSVLLPFFIRPRDSFALLALLLGTSCNQQAEPLPTLSTQSLLL